jgi:SAM-dependent methyltransferase
MSISDRLNRREEYYKAAIGRLRRAIDKGIIGEDTEVIREWLEKFAVGNGLDICVGDFPISEGAIGIDGDDRKLGAHYNIAGDELTPIKSNELDYVVTNYLDCFPNPLHTLQEWHRVIKPGGRLAFACCNAMRYWDNPEGALQNRHRLSAFVPLTVQHLLARAEFKDIMITEHNKHLLVSAVKA